MNPADLLDGIEGQTGAKPSWSVIFLHGLGDSGNGWAPVAPELVSPEWPAGRFVFPHAPERPITINGGMRMRAWYDIVGMEIAHREREADIRTSISQVEMVIAREVERGIPQSRIVLGGFSQGGAIALATGLRLAEPLAGIIALSTYLPLAPSTATESTPASRGTPVFMAHGQFDPVLPMALGLQSRDQLQAMGVQVEWHDYPMAHQAIAAEFAALKAWLGLRVAGA